MTPTTVSPDCDIVFRSLDKKKEKRRRFALIFSGIVGELEAHESAAILKKKNEKKTKATFTQNDTQS